VIAVLIPLATIFSFLGVFFKDSVNIINIGLQFLRYGSPVIYSIQNLPINFIGIFYFNPFTSSFLLFQRSLFSESLIYDDILISSIVWLVILYLMMYVLVFRFLKHVRKLI
jgi:ABC-2 type transport system permease protein